jgi:hypothetical protein
MDGCEPVGCRVLRVLKKLAIRRAAGTDVEHARARSGRLCCSGDELEDRLTLIWGLADELAKPLRESTRCGAPMHAD